MKHQIKWKNVCKIDFYWMLSTEAYIKMIMNDEAETLYQVASDGGINEVISYIDKKGWFDIESSVHYKYKIPYIEWLNKTGILEVDRLNRIIQSDDNKYFCIEIGGDGDMNEYLYIVSHI